MRKGIALFVFFAMFVSSTSFAADFSWGGWFATGLQYDQIDAEKSGVDTKDIMAVMKQDYGLNFSVTGEDFGARMSIKYWSGPWVPNEYKDETNPYTGDTEYVGNGVELGNSYIWGGLFENRVKLYGGYNFEFPQSFSPDPAIDKFFRHDTDAFGAGLGHFDYRAEKINGVAYTNDVDGIAMELNLVDNLVIGTVLGLPDPAGQKEVSKGVMFPHVEPDDVIKNGLIFGAKYSVPEIVDLYGGFVLKQFDKGHGNGSKSDSYAFWGAASLTMIPNLTLGAKFEMIGDKGLYKDGTTDKKKDGYKMLALNLGYSHDFVSVMTEINYQMWNKDERDGDNITSINLKVTPANVPFVNVDLHGKVNIHTRDESGWVDDGDDDYGDELEYGAGIKVSKSSGNVTNSVKFAAERVDHDPRTGWNYGIDAADILTFGYEINIWF